MGYTRLGVGVGSVVFVMNFSSSGEAIFSICKSGEFRTETGAAFTDELKRCRLATLPSDCFAFRSSVSGRLMDDDDDVAVVDAGATTTSEGADSEADSADAAFAHGSTVVTGGLVSGSNAVASRADGRGLEVVSRMMLLLTLVGLVVVCVHFHNSIRNSQLINEVARLRVLC